MAASDADIACVVPDAAESIQKAREPQEKKDVEMAEGTEIEKGVSSSSKPQWPLWKLILMALPQLGVQVLWGFIGPQSAPYMVHLGISPALATLNNVAGPTTGFFTGPIVGAWSDRCQSKYGRRRPIIVGGLISTCIAGLLFSASEHLFTGPAQIAFAVPMYWILDVTINILQTPHRALVADLASKEQQVPMQVVFVFMMAIGNFIAYSLMQIWAVPVDHMLELMAIIISLNVVCITIQFSVAREEQYTRDSSDSSTSICAPVVEVLRSVVGMPFLLYHLAAVQCLVWIGNTAWSYYAAQWFANSVYQGNVNAADNSPEKIAYADGTQAFAQAGLWRSGLQLISALVIIAIMMKTSLRPRLVYAPTIFIGAVVALLAAFAVHHSGTFATICFALSIMPETGSFAIPFGLVAILNKRAEEEGKQVSTALQMALLNCCITVGQQICHVSLAGIENNVHPLEKALPYVFVLAAIVYGPGFMLALCLDDRGSRS
eukprot:TRINITY_DN83313_c0_g1_i1.p1 TRINITY_DN83313_c0_g1~~TRINITY_DN83313_c0_g1_i1.p1  ORF type:complete len:490 (-),score=66.98 TRINITY_DN83313_c0_g1_i1:328-1797(-)